MTTKTVQLVDEQATLDFGAELAERVEPGNVIFLRGPLGAGKTTLVRGFVHELGHSGPVKSPTYTILETYELADLFVIHMDLYRLADPEELSFLGIEDYFQDPQMVALIEWPENGAGLLPEPTFDIELEHLIDGGRSATISGAL